MKTINLILIEDDQKKVEDIKEFLLNEFNYSNLIVKESYQSGLKEIVNNSFDFLLLDMSIPTWDKTPNNASGDYQKFGGLMILKELQRKNKLLPTVLISMFDDFGESDRSLTLVQIDEILKKEFPEYYHGAIFYGSGQIEWKNKLKELLSKKL